MPDGRCDAVSRLVKATAACLYRALTDRAQFARWIAPEGAHALIDCFDPRPGGSLEITLTFDRRGSGKTTSDTDRVKGCFLELQKDRRVRQAFIFESDDPAHAGTMIMTWVLTPAVDGTLVEVLAEDVPVGISKEDHQAGMESSLANLARLVETK
ncbi:MAG: SRPBCC domain-containing protein [Alphaproteobacteria bacterium]|nr:SRPBCC domain-containing protein [Alphaproteobacteria bacterium]